jgi:biotin carboxylase
MMTVQLPNGHQFLIRTTALHRRRCIGGAPYARPTDWIAQAGSVIGWGRTRREAVANLKAALRAS